MARNPLTISRNTASRRVKARDTGGCILLDSNSDFVTIPNAADLIPGEQSFFFAAWMYLVSYPNANNIILQYNNGAYSSGYLFSIVLSQDRLAAYVQSGGPIMPNPGVAKTINMKKARVVFRVSNVDLRIRLHIDGQLIATSSAIAAWNITANGDLRIGASSDLATSPIAYLSDVCIGMGEITDDDVANDFYDGIQLPNLVRRFQFNEGSGTTAVDSITGATATLSNSGLWSNFRFLTPRNSLTMARNAA